MITLKKKKLILTIIGGLSLYLFSAGISFAVFRYLGGPVTPGLLSPVPLEKARERVDLSAPKTEACPLNNKLYTKGEKEIWEDRRPLAIMIENHADARPQSGLSRADVVYEAVAEGGITRFMAVYLCGASAADVLVGPVRSARTYYLDWASEYGEYPLYAHVGGANEPGPSNALGQIGEYGWLGMGNDLNQFSLDFSVFWRDYERLGHSVATEHTMYSKTDQLYRVAGKRGLTNKDKKGNSWDEKFSPWEFKNEAKAEDRGDVDKIEVTFWSGYQEYGVKWQYNSETNDYSRFHGDQPHIDLNDNGQLKAKVVIVQFAREKGPINELKHLLYTTTGSGQALIFQDGEVTQGTWRKADRQSRTTLTDSRGKMIELNSGVIWIEVVPLGKEVIY